VKPIFFAAALTFNPGIILHPRARGAANKRALLSLLAIGSQEIYQNLLIQNFIKFQ
jgi:hypothetical protein